MVIDAKRGLANERGLPWHLPGDLAYYRERTKAGPIIMGYHTYQEQKVPLGHGTNYVFVVSGRPAKLRPGFVAVHDLAQFLNNYRGASSPGSPKGDIWNIGGARLFAQTMDMADELYITLIDGDFNCTKFFPEYEADFELAGESQPQVENGTEYRFTTWRRKGKQ